MSRQKLQFMRNMSMVFFKVRIMTHECDHATTRYVPDKKSRKTNPDLQHTKKLITRQKWEHI